MQNNDLLKVTTDKLMNGEITKKVYKLCHKNKLDKKGQENTIDRLSILS